jgi:hypothetical protein
VAPGDWTKVVKSHFDAEVDKIPAEQRDDPHALEEHFADITEWHTNAMTAELTHLKSKGKLILPVAKYIRTFTNLVCLSPIQIIESDLSQLSGCARIRGCGRAFFRFCD